MGGFAMTGKKVCVLATLAVALLVAMNFSAVGQDKQGKKAGKAPVLTFEVYMDKGGDFRYRIVDDAGTNLGGSGKGYDKKEDVLKVVDTIKKGAATAKIDDETDAKKADGKKADAKK
jgi:uncharacterized protein